MTNEKMEISRCRKCGGVWNDGNACEILDFMCRQCNEEVLHETRYDKFIVGIIAESKRCVEERIAEMWADCLLLSE